MTESFYLFISKCRQRGNLHKHYVLRRLKITTSPPENLLKVFQKRTSEISRTGFYGLYALPVTQQRKCQSTEVNQ